MISVHQISFAGWDDCIRLSNGCIELRAPTAVGPRLLYFGFVGGRNLLYVDETTAGKTGGTDYRLYGGHRLWIAPQSTPGTYLLENDPVEVTVADDRVSLRRPADAETGVVKEIVVRLVPDAPRAEVTHRLTNEGTSPVEGAPWGITQMREDTVGVVPIPGSDEGVDPDRTLSLWPYTDITDERLSFSSCATWVDQRPTVETELKIGASAADGWVAGVHDDVALLKVYPVADDASYPDRGSSAEIYADEKLLETETLAPLSMLKPDETVEFTEEWRLLRGFADRDREAMFDRLSAAATQ
jgi:hypothetical protein